MAAMETYKPAFTTSPGTNLAGIPTQHLKLTTPYISYGLPYDDACAKYITNTFKASRVYIVASKSLAANTDKLDRLVSSVGESKVVGVRKGITPHTPWSEILTITAECRRLRVDCIVTLGAGSITDGCKIVVLYFSLAGATDDATKHKQAFMYSGMGSKLIILDPELCLTTPEYAWLSTGMRSVDHCVEAICSPQAKAESDQTAEEALKLLVPSLLRCKLDKSDVEARRNCQMAVRLAMESVRSGVPMGGSHAIGHQLGPLGVPHGVTSCIMCPAVMKYNSKHAGNNPEILHKQQRVLDILWSEAQVTDILEKAGLDRDAADLGDALDAVVRSLELPRTLSEMGITIDMIPKLSRRALDDFWAATNPVPLLKAEQVWEILEMVA